ncbi:hypothetical protein [Candidatus Lokiarchaeum ossiferum]|uniref:hypothetical protein n=1 Tax=Candidatus Lokiarchaeum ossiferum TaxID=2951803 RepID=UPI00352DB9D1
MKSSQKNKKANKSKLNMKILKYRLKKNKKRKNKDRNILIVKKDSIHPPKLRKALNTIKLNAKNQSHLHLYTESIKNAYNPQFKTVFLGNTAHSKNILNVIKNKNIELILVDTNIENKNGLYLETAANQIPIVEFS